MVSGARTIGEGRRRERGQVINAVASVRTTAPTSYTDTSRDQCTPHVGYICDLIRTIVHKQPTVTLSALRSPYIVVVRHLGRHNRAR
jgi:hypothetical protein